MQTGHYGSGAENQERKDTVGGRGRYGAVNTHGGPIQGGQGGFSGKGNLREELKGEPELATSKENTGKGRNSERKYASCTCKVPEAQDGSEQNQCFQACWWALHPAPCSASPGQALDSAPHSVHPASSESLGILSERLLPQNLAGPDQAPLGEDSQAACREAPKDIISRIHGESQRAGQIFSQATRPHPVTDPLPRPHIPSP